MYGYIPIYLAYRGGRRQLVSGRWGGKSNSVRVVFEALSPPRKSEIPALALVREPESQWRLNPPSRSRLSSPLRRAPCCSWPAENFCSALPALRFRPLRQAGLCRSARSGCWLKALSCAKLGGGRFEFFCVVVLASLPLGLRPAVAALWHLIAQLPNSCCLSFFVVGTCCGRGVLYESPRRKPG